MKDNIMHFKGELANNIILIMSYIFTYTVINKGNKAYGREISSNKFFRPGPYVSVAGICCHIRISVTDDAAP